MQAARRNMPPIESLINLDDFTKAAEYCLPHTAWAYYDVRFSERLFIDFLLLTRVSSFRHHQSAADDEYTKRENNYAYRRYWFNPRSLHKVRDIDLSSTILGGRIKTSLPVYISPAAMAKLGHPDGELNLVRAASTGGIMHGISINASCSLEEMDEVYKEGDPRIFQIYLDVNRKNSEELVKKVEKMGFEGIMFTVGESSASVHCFHARVSGLVVDIYFLALFDRLGRYRKSRARQALQAVRQDVWYGRHLYLGKLPGPQPLLGRRHLAQGAFLSSQRDFSRRSHWLTFV